MLKAMLKPAVSPDASAAYPSRIADTIWARLWLAEGFPVADVLTMLEVRRRFEFSRKRFVSPPWTCARQIETMGAWKRRRFVCGILSRRSGGLLS